jgi:hypothetical protein
MGSEQVAAGWEALREEFPFTRNSTRSERAILSGLFCDVSGRQQGQISLAFITLCVIMIRMIIGFADKETENLFITGKSKKTFAGPYESGIKKARLSEQGKDAE